VHPSIAAAVIAAGLAVLAAGTSLPALALLVLGAVVTGIGAGLLFTSLLARVVALAPPHGQSNILTGFFLAGYIGLALPVVALGALDQLVSASTLMTVFAAVATVLLAAAAVALSRTRDRTRETT
jgi:MFS family permease